MNSLLSKIFGNPWVGLSGSIASVIGVGLAIWFYLASVQKPELSFYVSPLRTSIVKADAATSLTVQFNNTQIKTDVSAMQIAFWNAGKQPIKKEDIISPIQVILGSHIQILEVALLESSRKSTGIILNDSNSQIGVVSIEWKILEQNDGGVFQVIYAGDTSVNPSFFGEVVGQRSPRTTQYTGTISSPEDQYKRGNILNVIMGVVMVFSSLAFLGTSLYIRVRAPRQNRQEVSRSKKVFGLIWRFIFIGAYFVMGIYLISRAFSPMPPFRL